MRKGGDHTSTIIGMNGVSVGPILQFLNRLAEIFQDLPVQEFNFAGRIHGTYQAGNAVDDQAKIEFARAQRFLSTLPVVNVRAQGIPANDPSFRIPRGERAYMEPAVYAIGTTDTVLRLIWMPDFDRAPPRGQQARKVIGMNNAGGGPTFQFVKRHAKIIEALLTDEFEFAFRRRSINEPGNVIDDQ